MTPVPANETAENWEPRANGACLACGRQLTRGTSAVPACQHSPLPPPPPRHLNSLAAASSFVGAERGTPPRSLRWAAYSSGRQYFYFLRVKQMPHRLRPELGKSRISILPRRGDGRRRRGLVRQAASHLLYDVRNIGWHTARCEGNRKTTRTTSKTRARKICLPHCMHGKHRFIFLDLRVTNSVPDRVERNRVGVCLASAYLAPRVPFLLQLTYPKHHPLHHRCLFCAGEAPWLSITGGWGGRAGSLSHITGACLTFWSRSTRRGQGS